MTISPIGSPGGGLGGPTGLIGGPWSPTTGFVLPGAYVPSVVADPDGNRLVDPDGNFIGFGVETTTGLAGYLPFFVAEIEVSRPAAALVLIRTWGGAPWGAPSLLAAGTEESSTIHVSDIGYRTPPPATAYHAVMQPGFAVDARVPLSPAQVGIVWAYGSLNLINDDHRFDAILAQWNVDGRAITVRYGTKTWDDSRGIFLDPPLTDMTTLFTGIGSPWTLSEFTAEIPIRDASYWLQRPLQSTTYAGSGTYEGDAELAGLPKPKVRGTAYNVPLTLIDRAALIYQYNDAAGSVLALYEGGAESITFQADTTNLYSGTTTSGQYRTDDSRGLIQLGTPPADNAALTADVFGEFPVAGAVTIAAEIARYLMVEDCFLPAEYIDAVSFTDAAADYPYEAGWYWAPGDRIDGASAVAQCLASFGARIVPAVSGALQCFPLETIDIGAIPAGAFDTSNIIRIDPRPLPTDITPPVFRVRVAYQHNYTVQTSGLIGSVTDAHRQFVQVADRFAGWSDGAVALAYRNANDLLPFGGGLTTEADAIEVAERTGALFGVRRWLFDMTVPLVAGIEIEFSEVVHITYPVHVLQNGAKGLVVGRSFNADDMQIVLTVLV